MEDKNRIKEQIGAFQDGNEIVWRKIVENNSNWLYVMSIRMLWDSNDAEEVVQECFLRAFKKRGQLRNFNQLRGWLRTICVRICLRKHSENKTVSLHNVEAFMVPDNQISPEKTATAREEIKKVLQGLAKLSQRQQTCLTLSVFEKFSMNQIAKAVGIKEGTVRRYIFEARQSLHQYLKIKRRNDDK